MMSKEELLAFCRHYQGESECPANASLSFWNYEREWVELKISAKDETSVSAAMLSSFVNAYLDAGLAEFEKFDKTPMSLKALLFNRFSHWLGTLPEEFKQYYLSEYRK